MFRDHARITPSGIRQWDNLDSTAREVIVDSIAGLGDVAVSELIKSLQNESSAIRRISAEILGKVRPWTALQPLVTALGDESAKVRCAAAEALGKIGSPEAVPALVALGRDDSIARFEAYSALRWISHVEPTPEFRFWWDECLRSAMPEFVKSFQSSTTEVRANSVELVGSLRVVDAEPMLVEALHDPEACVRKGALVSLSRILLAIPMTYLQKAMHDPSQEVRSAAASLAIANGEEALSALILALRDEAIPVRFDAAVTLGRIKHKGAIQALIHALRNNDHEVHSWYMRKSTFGLHRVIINALKTIGTTEAMPVLIEQLQSSNRFVCRHAAFVLGEIRAAEAIPALVKVAVHSDEEVRRLACRALGQIGEAVAKAAHEAVAQANAAWKVIIPVLGRSAYRDPSVLVRVQSHQILETLGHGCDAGHDFLADCISALPELSEEMLTDAANARKQLHTFCLVGEVLVQDRLDTFTLTWMTQQILSRFKTEIAETTIRDHLRRVQLVFERHLPDLIIFDHGMGQRGYTITSLGWKAWLIAMQTLGRRVPSSAYAALQCGLTAAHYSL